LEAMASKHIRADMNYAWPTAELAVMGSEGAVNIIFKREIASSDTPEEARTTRVEEYRNTFANPFKAAELGYVDEILYPEHTRERLIRSLEMLRNKRDTNPPRKHGNIPL